MTRLLVVLLAVTAWIPTASSQSVESMVGIEGAFFDVQFLRELWSDSGATVFGRTRAEVSYGNKADLFSALYVSYSLPLGLGLTAVGRVQSGLAGADAGPHYFFGTRRFSLFALAAVDAVELRNRPKASWFSIMRYRHPLSEKLQVYSSIEVFSLWERSGHIATIERLRLGVEWYGWALGAAINGRHAVNASNYNPGVFVRKEF